MKVLRDTEDDLSCMVELYLERMGLSNEKDRSFVIDEMKKLVNVKSDVHEDEDEDDFVVMHQRTTKGGSIDSESTEAYPMSLTKDEPSLFYPE